MTEQERNNLFKFDNDFEDFFKKYVADMNEFEAMQCRSELYNAMRMGWNACKSMTFKARTEKNKKIQMLYKEIY